MDGSTGEGGGQIIRTALALSMLTGTPIEIERIRAGRAKPGLMRQHLMCVQASQALSNAIVKGAKLGSTGFSFHPKGLLSQVADSLQTPSAHKREADSGSFTNSSSSTSSASSSSSSSPHNESPYSFDIGSAGSTSLVLQTLLPALLFAQGHEGQGQSVPSVTIKGGTHCPFAPTTDFLQRAFVPALAKLGMQVTVEMPQAGFVPIGGGEVSVTAQPFMRRAGTPPLQLTKRGDLVSIELVASNVNLDFDICKRELACAKATLIEAGIDETLIHTKGLKLRGIGEGNTCFAVVTHHVADSSQADGSSHTDGSSQADKGENLHHEVFSLLGEKRTSAEKMGNRLAGLVKRYLFKTDALVDEYLTDQLLLPLALSGGGEFSARMISQHTETQAWLIEQFLPVEIKFEPLSEHNTLVRVVC
ncbi:MAG: RNA 3'-terminal phosphate cyclase [Psychrobacter sp.]|nr:RNA 3'-terminal phosphate cyclase [Psychrobacter sp.]